MRHARRHSLVPEEPHGRTLGQFEDEATRTSPGICLPMEGGLEVTLQITNVWRDKDWLAITMDMGHSSVCLCKDAEPPEYRLFIFLLFYFSSVHSRALLQHDPCPVLFQALLGERR
ncbi:uncharacterized protein CTRU02_205765 [Colletotrichum truncatum]|uniref:Uncharacterized protein n=1 Tax=Colletotrichum truncatum TaxID=5467 RepID=A0ACC3Z518_COLTU